MSFQQMTSSFLIVFFLTVLYLMYRILMPFFDVIFWAAVIAFAFYPIYRRIRLWFKGHENAASCVMTALILLTVLPTVFFVVFRLIEEAVLFSRGVADYFQSESPKLFFEYLFSLPAVRQLESAFFKWEEVTAQIQGWAVSFTGKIGSFTAGFAAAAAKNIVVFLFELFLAVFILFFFFRDGERIGGFFYNLMPLNEESKRELFQKTQDTFSALIHGQLIIALIKAVLLGAAFLILGLPFPGLFGLLGFFMSLIPLLGAHLIWVPFSVYLAFQQDYLTAVILALIGTLVIAPSDNVLFPWLIGKKMRLPYLLLFLGILGGLAAFGIKGIFLGPSVISVFFVLVNIYRRRFSAGYQAS